METFAGKKVNRGVLTNGNKDGMCHIKHALFFWSDDRDGVVTLVCTMTLVCTKIIFSPGLVPFSAFFVIILQNSPHMAWRKHGSQLLTRNEKENQSASIRTLHFSWRPFQYLSVFALTAFHVGRSMNRLRKKKKGRSHLRLCLICTCRRNTKWAFNCNWTSPSWGSCCHCRRASSRHLLRISGVQPGKQSEAVALASVLGSENFAFNVRNVHRKDGVWIFFFVPFPAVIWLCFAQGSLQCSIFYKGVAPRARPDCDLQVWTCATVSVVKEQEAQRLKLAFMRKLQISHVANKWTFSSSLSLSVPLSQQRLCTHTHTRALNNAGGYYLSSCCFKLAGRRGEYTGQLFTEGGRFKASGAGESAAHRWNKQQRAMSWSHMIRNWESRLLDVFHLLSFLRCNYQYSLHARRLCELLFS